MSDVKVCQYCGNEIKNPTHWNQKYHNEPQNGNKETCSWLARKEKGCRYTRDYRKKFGREYTNDLGSKNAHLGASMIQDFEAEYNQVHKEKTRLLGH